MSAFKVGQRVRVRKNAKCDFGFEQFAGVETTIRAKSNKWPFDWVLDIRSPMSEGFVHAKSSGLEPLTDPRADEFISDMERFAKLAERDAARIRKIAEEKAS